MTKVLERFVIDPLFNLLGVFSPVVGLTLLSVIAGVVLVLLYGKISNQRRLKMVKRSILAGIFESVLFRHDLRLSLTAQGRMLRGGALYFAAAVPPILILALPSVLLLAHINARYGFRGLQPGDAVVFSMDISDEDTLFETRIEPPRGVKVSLPVRDIEAKRVSWRLDIDDQIVPGTAFASDGREPGLRVLTGETEAVVPIVLGTSHGIVQGEAFSSSWWRPLYPGGDIPNSLKPVVSRLSLAYPVGELRIWGVVVDWLVFFLVVSLGAGLIGSKIFGVEV